MFVALATTKNPKYRGLDRVCDLYVNAKISLFGKVDDETEAAWLSYIDLLGADPIICDGESLSIISRIIGLCEKNRSSLEIVLFTADMDESCNYSAEFIGFDVAGASYSSILSETAWRSMPIQFSEQLNESGLFDTFEAAAELAKYANSLTASEIEPDFPFVPVKVYILAK